MSGENKGREKLSALLSSAGSLIDRLKTDDVDIAECKTLLAQLKSGLSQTLQKNQRLEREAAERKRSESAMREHARKFQAVFHSVHDGLIINILNRQHGIIGQTLEVNERAVALFRYTQKELKLLTPQETFLKHADVEEITGKLLAGKEVFYEAEIYSAVGKCHLCDMRSKPFVICGKEYVVTVIRNIQTQRDSERTLRERELELSVAQEIADLSHWNHNFKTGEFKWSRQITRIIGNRKNLTVAESLNLVYANVHPDDLKKVKRIIEYPEENRNFSFDFRIFDSKGQIRYIFAKGRIEFDADGKPEKLSGINQDITRKKITELRLKDSEQNLRRILEAISIGTWEYDTESDLFCVSRQVEKFMGYKNAKSTFHSLFLWRRIHFQDKKHVREEFNKLLKDETSIFNSSFRIKLKTGKYVWVLARAVYISNAPHQKQKIVGCIEDLSESMRFDKMKEQFEFLQRLANVIPIPMFYKDLEGYYLGHNQAFADFASKIVKEPVVGKTAFEVFTNQNYPVALTIDRVEKRLISDGSGSCANTFQIVTRSNETQILVEHQALLRGYDNKPQYIMGALIDITSIMQIENRLRQTTRRLNTVLNAMREIVMCYDLNLSLEWANRAARETFGINSKRFVGKKWKDIWFAGKDIANNQFPAQRILTGYYEMLRSKIHAGSGRIYEVCAYPIKDRRGKISGVIEAALDITEQEHAETKARIHREQLIQADKMKSLGILVAGVAHEINNPNNFIGINIALLEKICNDTTPVISNYLAKTKSFAPGGIPAERLETSLHDLISGIKDGSERITKIVDSLKSYVRHTPESRIEEFSLNDALSNAIFLLKNQLNRSTHKFNMITAEKLPLIRGVQQRIEQVIINIIQNACQSLANPGRGIEVKSYCWPTTEEVVVQVTDEGIGISPQDLRHISDPFFTTKRNIGGTGLGLSISSTIIKEHNGRLEIESTPGHGTTVKIILPTTDYVLQK
ncbi:MAG: PAS domain S-box protein [Victivallaceae bacterium]